MLDLKFGHTIWPETLEPAGFDTCNKESFRNWWLRNENELKHLDPLIVEQWIFRHWIHSLYCFLPLNKLTWESQIWTTEKILDLAITFGEPRTHDSGKQDFIELNKYDGTVTTNEMNSTGTWDYPIVVLHTPLGMKLAEQKWASARYVLIEGHKRVRYLNALQQCGSPSKTHSVFVLELANN